MKRATFAALATLPATAWAGKNGADFFSAIPTLDELGLGLLIALVAGIAGWAAGKRRRP